MKISSPEKLTADHDLSTFHSGEAVLDEWLRRRALHNEARGASRTYIVCSLRKVVGYYTLATGAITHAQVSGKVKRNMPDPIPVMVLGRLAVDHDFQQRGIGTALLRDAVLRTILAADIAGIRAILVHALSDNAKRFYERYGFMSSPVDPLTVMITVAEAQHLLEET